MRAGSALGGRGRGRGRGIGLESALSAAIGKTHGVCLSVYLSVGGDLNKSYTRRFKGREDSGTC